MSEISWLNDFVKEEKTMYLAGTRKLAQVVNSSRYISPHNPESNMRQKG